jgi:Mg-chelatase subunit ChlD/uncharacterized membrane protein
VLTLSTPWLLLLLPPAVLVLWLLRRPVEDLSPLRLTLAWLVRSAGVALLLLAMSGPSLVRPGLKPPFTILAIDVSESVDDAALEETLPAAARADAVIAFAGRAVVLADSIPDRLLARRRIAELRSAMETDPAAAPRFHELAAWRESLEPLRTALDAAISLAQTLYRAGRENRTILLTDGRAAAIPTDPTVRYARLPAPRRRDFVVRALHGPPAVRYGEPFDVRVELETSYACDWSVALTVDEQPARVEKFHLEPGRATVTLRNLQKEKPLDSGLHRLRVNVLAAGDEEPRNNVAYGSVTVVGRLRVLVVEGAPLEGENLAKLLAIQSIEHERIAADQFNAWRDDLDRFTAVVLAGVPAASLLPSDVDRLGSYVADGGGLLYLGSHRLAAEKALRPELAALLPVEFLPPNDAPTVDPGPGPVTPAPSPHEGEPKKILAPSIALCLLIDRSGSMAGTPLTLAKEACIGAAKALTEKDYVAVIAFDAKPILVMEFVAADQSATIEEKVLRLTADGGTNIHVGLEAALRLFSVDPRGAQAGIKHCVLLSDGKTTASDMSRTLADLRAASVTVSTICVGVGEDFDFPIMHTIARECRGRARFADSFKAVPQMFVEEAREVVKEVNRKLPQPPVRPPDRVGPVKPPDVTPVPSRRSIPVVAKDDHEVLRGIDRTFPRIAGLRGGKARSGATVPLTTGDGSPVLSTWRYDLGKTAAWLPDVGGPWSPEWNEWPSTSKLFAQLVRHLSSAAEDLDLAGRIRLERGLLHIERASAADAFSATLAQPARRPLLLEPAADGSLVARLPLDRVGAPVEVVVSRPRADGGTETLPLATAKPYEEELASLADAPSRLELADARPLDEIGLLWPAATIAPDVRKPLAIWCLLAALLLLPLDVFLRRIRR